MTSYIYNMIDTWNDGATTFTAVKMNVTDTTSAAASLLMDLQVGGSSRFNVGKTGSLKLGISPAGTNQAGTNVIIAGSQGTGTGAGGSIIFQVAPAGGSGPAQNALATALTIDSTKLATFEGRVASRFGYTFGSPQFYDASIATGAGFGVQGAQTSVIYGGSTAVAAFEDGANGIRLPGVRSLGWVDGHALANVADVRLWRDAANTLALRNSTTAQAFNIYNTYTSGTSYERYSVDWITTANLVIVGPNKGSAGGTQRVQRLSYLEDGGAGSTVPLLGSTCPAASGTVKSWIKVITSDGTTAYVPCWA